MHYADDRVVLKCITFFVEMSAFVVNKHLHYYAMFRSHRPICIMLMSVVLKCAILPICASHNSSCMRVTKTFITLSYRKLSKINKPINSDSYNQQVFNSV